jgi:tetratricopeptide (TPR) repeat protein
VPGTTSPTPAAEGWPPKEIPAVTLTPTPSSAVPNAALDTYTAAQNAYAANNYSRALEFVDQALALAPDQCEFLTLRGQILVDLVRPLDGSVALRQALSIDPFYAPARSSMAELYLDYQRWRDAAAEYTRYLTLSPDDPTGWYALGQIREHQGRPLEAIAAYSNTLELDPSHVDGLVRRGTLWLERENDVAAWPDYTALIAAAPSAEAYLTRGEINLRLNAPLMAAADFEAGLALQTSGTPSYTVMMQLGQAYLQGGAAIQAVETFSQTIGLTSSIEPRLWLGQSYLAAENYPAALQLFDDLFPLVTPLNVGELLAGRGKAYLALEEYEAAIVDLDYALYYAKESGEQAAILEQLGAAYGALGQVEEAIANLTAAYDLAPTPTLLYQRGVLYLELGDDEAAIADLTLFLETADPDETVQTLLQDAQVRLDSLTAESP